MTFSHSRRSFIFSVVLLAGDLLCVTLSVSAAFWIRFRWDRFLEVLPMPPGTGIPSASSYGVLFIPSILILGASFINSGFYRRRRLSTLDDLVRIIVASAKGWTVVLAATFMYREVSFSRGVVGLAAILCVLFLFLFREMAKLFYDRVGPRIWQPLPILILGSGRMAVSIRRILRQYRDMKVTHVSARTAEELDAHLVARPAREIYAGEPDLDHKTLIAMSDVCSRYGIPFKIVPDVLELRMGEVVLDDSLGLPTYHVRPASLNGSTFLYKRLFDISISIIILSLIWPVLAVIVLLIKLDSSGPVIFHQPRPGLKGEVFPFFKFRSMVADAEARLEALKARSERGGGAFKMARDPRITPVGRWLRRLSLDELPQIFNVLRGEMSLVGPRPQPVWEAAATGQQGHGTRRLNVLPGITGLWQVSGRAKLSFQQMIDLDTYYIEHWSPGLDLSILFRTLPAILKGEGAY